MSRNLTGGYYIVSLGDVELLGESVSLPDVAKLLYEAKKYKFVVFQDIVIGGNKKVATPAMFEASMAYTTEPEDWDEETDGEFVPEPIYTATIYNLYGKNIAIDAEGGASVTDVSVAVDPATLYGKFVRVIDAPESTTLTDEQIELFKEGIFVNGEFLGFKNPIFSPLVEVQTNLWVGFIIGAYGTGQYAIEITPYSISMGTKVISASVNQMIYKDFTGTTHIAGAGASLGASNVYIGTRSQTGRIEIAGGFTNTVMFWGKSVPNYPSDQTDKTYALKLVNGTLTWVEETA